MAPAFLGGAKVGVQAALDLDPGLYIRAKGQAVGMVMAAAVFADMLAPGDCAADAMYLVCRDADADPAAAKDQAEAAWSGVDRLPHCLGEAGIIRALFAQRAVVRALVAELSQVFKGSLFEFEAAVVAAEMNLQGVLQSQARPSRPPSITKARMRWMRLNALSVSGQPLSML